MSLQERVTKIHFTVGDGEFENEVFNVRYFAMDSNDVCLGIAHYGRRVDGSEVELYHESHYPSEDVRDFFLETPKEIILSLVEKGQDCMARVSAIH